ncbi:hypothetical protein O0I10_011460 [Lichtheimia ornata]|uniref:Uncharacterized protein n=1 Tax=Lichtheimia ornata TaxID=688661 RepID=A0AAD7UUT9_9FUNG|nr:uncharacterized protein O0I10_011460 [Lichtheimia ornata]KAJ8652860.1 hypothetical protein O0I10_011460 [Lichtheimia ornata]
MVSVWSDFTQQPILAIKSGSCTSVIADSTCRLQQCCNFELALKDAAWMRQLVPSSVAVYLCAGHVYSLQGRQKAAVEIYDQGLAVQKDHFINELPLDITMNIAPWILSQGEMAPSEIREYLDVSRVWREKLLSCVRELHVFSTAKDDLGSNDDLLTRFPSLQTLIAKDPGYNYEMIGRTIDALTTLGSTLTHLEVQSYAYRGCLGQILSSCPNLVHLTIRNVDIRMDTAPECHTNLKRLLFSHFDDELDIHDMTKRLPGLEVFAANPVYDFKDVKILQDNCPNLKVVICNDDDDSYFYLPTATTTTSDHGDGDRVGVHTFYVDCDEANDFFVDLEDLVDFMRRNSHTLQHVYFYIPVPRGRMRHDDNDNDTYDTSILAHAIQGAGDPLFTKMTTYTQYLIDPKDMLMARWVARGSPHLTKMEISMDDTEVDTSVLFDDLVGRCELESLTFGLNGNPTTMDMGGIERFIHYHGSIDSLLHTLSLPKHIRLSNDALDALTTLPRLATLSISWPLMKEADNTKSEHVRCFGFIGKLDQLQHLHIWSDDLILDDVFLQLSKLNITSLELDIPRFLESSKPMALLSLLQCPNLRVLFLRPFYRLNDPLLEDIRSMLGSKIRIIPGV